jgi:hypothetical protein
MVKRKRRSRTATVSHGFLEILIREGHTGILEFKLTNPDQVITPESKTFEAACREALKHVLAHGGEMKGSYERE